jgi:hypothetical protein
LGGPLGGAVGGFAGSALDGGGLKSDLIGGALGGAGGALSGATGSLIPADSILGGANSDLTSLFSPISNAVSSGVSSIGDATGLSGVGSDISQGLSNFSDASGLSSLLGGTAAPTSGLDAAYGGIENAAADPAIASSAITPGAGLTNALPGSGSVGAAGGGAAGSGFNLAGASDSLPSSTTGSLNLDIGSPSFTQNSGDFLGGQANPLAPAGLSNGADLSGSSAPFPNVITPSVNTGSLDSFSSSEPVNLTAQPSNGLLNNLLGNGNAATPAGLSTAGDGAFGSGLSTTGSGALGSGIPSTAGGGMGLSSLLGGGTNSASSGGSNILNGLLKGGLGYLLNGTASNDPIANATQAAQQNFAPYLQAGNQAENTLANLYGTNGTAAQQSAQQNFQNTPGYQFALNQGINAVDANAAAMGQPLSGNNQQTVNNYAQGTANQTYNNYVNQLQNLASGGLTAAGGSGTAGLTGAAAGAQQSQNNANNRNTAIGTGLNALFPSGINLAQLLGGQGSGGSGSQGLLSLLSGA